MLSEVACRGQHFQDQGHRDSFSLYEPTLSQQIALTLIIFLTLSNQFLILSLPPAQTRRALQMHLLTL